MAALFQRGGDLKARLLVEELPELPEEDGLLAACRARVGPHASEHLLRWHLRAARGNVVFAINSYFRAVLAAPAVNGEREDFERPRHASGSQRSGQDCEAAAAGAAPPAAPPADAAMPLPLDSLPGPALERVLSHLDLPALLAAASTCSCLRRAASADGIWQGLFRRTWGCAVFPTNATRHDGPQAPLPPQQQQQQQRQQQRQQRATAPTPAADAPAGALSGSGAAEGPSSSAGAQQQQLVRRWTGSCVAGPPGGGAGRGSGGSSPACACGCGCVRRCACRAGARPPAGSWRAQYRQQAAYAGARRCPQCGEGPLLPLLFGYPSRELVAGAAARRLVLGGDHLVDSCCAWACLACKEGLVHWPYATPPLWLHDGEAAGPAGPRRGGAASAQAPPAGLPRYTYEL